MLYWYVCVLFSGCIDTERQFLYLIEKLVNTASVCMVPSLELVCKGEITILQCYWFTNLLTDCGISSTHDSEETCAMQSIKDGPDSFQLIICSFYKNKDHFSCPKLAIVSLLFTMVFFFHLLIYFKF